VLDGAGLRALHRLVVQVATRVKVGVSGVDAQVGSSSLIAVTTTKE
jgi:hypothetical protein